MPNAGRTSTRRDPITTGTLRRRHSVRDSYGAMTRDIGSMPVTETAATETAATETGATETATRVAEREAFLATSSADLKPHKDKVISNLKCRAYKAWHFFFFGT